MRRTLLGLSVLGLALIGRPSLAESFDMHGAETLGWRLALQSWTVQGTVFGAIDYAQQIGLTDLEIFPNQAIGTDDGGKFNPDMTEAQIGAVLDRAREAGIAIRSYGVTGIPGDEAAARKMFDWARAIGIRTLVTEPDPKDLPRIDKLAGEYGMKIAIHDHPKPSRYWDPAYVHELTKGLKNVGYCADVGHWRRSGLDPVETLKKYGDKVVSLHFKDLAGGEGTERLHDVIWGTGTSNAAEMLKVLKDKGFKGTFAIEFESNWDVPTLRKCAEFFYDQANKLAG